MEHAFRESRERMNLRLEKQRREARKERLKENICFTIVLTFITVVTCILLVKTNQDFMNSCQEQGYSEAYCIAHN